MENYRQLFSEFKKLRNWKQGKYKDLFALDLLRKNRSNIKIILIMLLFVYPFYILLIDLPRYTNGTINTNRAYIWIFSGRMSIFSFSLIALIGSFIFHPEITEKNRISVWLIQRTITILIAASLLVNAVGDYLLMGSIETYIGVFLALAVLIQMEDVFSFFFFFLTFLTFLGILIFLSPDHSLLPATLFTNCLSFSFLSFIVSRITYYSELNRFRQKMIIVEQKEMLQELSSIDQLTKAYNRRKFDDLIANEIERANRYENRFSVLMLDIDHFKDINDTYGHIIGDEVLKEISRVVKENLRRSDSLIRWGGEEFVIIAVETTLPNALILGEKLRMLISAYNFPEVGRITSSFGVSSYRNGDSMDSLMKRVDDALYAAKKNGRNKVESA